ncbi:MAG: hypothetical protein PHV34_24795 [Verrucomicrobiae bacterium]|nr:hypothetical protein [Verrucomicrobiae bacterium]
MERRPPDGMRRSMKIIDPWRIRLVSRSFLLQPLSMQRRIVGLLLTVILWGAGCATAPRYSVTRIREPKTTARVRVEAMIVEAETNVIDEFLTALNLKTLECTGKTAHTAQVHAVLARFQQKPGFTIKRFPSLTLADGEKREANCQKNMRYAAEYHDDLTVKTWATRGAGLRWSCAADINKDDSIALKAKVEHTVFERWIEYKSHRVENGRETETTLKQPAFNKRSMSTNVIIQNGTTIVLGSLIREENTHSNARTKTSRMINLFFLFSAEILPPPQSPH